MGIVTEPKSIGLKNLGNTCYMSAALQALFSYNTFRDLIITYKTDKKLAIHRTLGILFDRMYTQSADVTKALEDFRDKFLAYETNHELFVDWTEHDSREFHDKLMESLNLEGNGISYEQYSRFPVANSEIASDVQKAWDLTVKPYRKEKLYMDYMNCLHQETTRCSFGHEYTIYQPFWSTALLIGDNVYLLSTQSCIDVSQKMREKLEEFKCFFDNYQCQGSGRPYRLYVKMPKLLVIQLSLFTDTFSPKLRPNLIVNQYIVVDEVNYELLAFIAHHGNSPQHGHYITIRRYNNEWIEYNDDNPIQSLTSKTLCSKLMDAYVLYYRECDQVIHKYSDFEYNQIQSLKENPSIHYTTLSVFNEQQLPLWTERQKTDSDFDLENQEILKNTIQHQNISVNEYFKTVESRAGPQDRYYVYIGTDPITKIILLCNITYCVAAKPKPSDTPSDRSPKPSVQSPKHEEKGEEKDFRLDASGHRWLYCVAPKACVVRSLAEDANGLEMYQLMLSWTVHSKCIEYCVPQEEDSWRWYLFIENFVYAKNRNFLLQMFGDQDEDGSYLTCTEPTHFELTRFDRKTKQISCVPINTVIPHSSNNVLKLAIQVKPFGEKGHRNMWYSTDREPDSGIVELDSSLEYEKQLHSQTRNNTYFGIFVYNNAKLVMRDYFEFSGKTPHCTLFLDATFIMVERQLRFTFSPEEYTKTYDFKNLKNAKAIRSVMTSTLLKHPILFLRDLPSQHKSKVWEFTVESQKSRIGGRNRGLFYLPSDDAIKFIDYLDWVDGHKYIRYYQKVRDWSTTIVMANNIAPAGVYQTEKQTAGEPKSIWSGIQPDTWDRSHIS